MKKSERAFLVAAVLVAVVALPIAAAERTIHLEASIEAPVAEVYRLWTTSVGARTLFPGADAEIGTEVGGPYTVIFDPEGSPDGSDNGTRGCRILGLERDRAVRFEWRFPTWADELNVEPWPTRVEVRLTAAGEGRTRIALDHHGFGRGALWDRLFDYFTAAWGRVLHGVELRYAANPDVSLPEGASRTSLYVVMLRPGPKWQADRQIVEQARLFNHVAYMYSLIGRGLFKMGGPIGNDGRGLAVMNVPDEATARRLMDVDPAVLAGTFSYEVLEWRPTVEPAR